MPLEFDSFMIVRVCMGEDDEIFSFGRSFKFFSCQELLDLKGIDFNFSEMNGLQVHAAVLAQSGKPEKNLPALGAEIEFFCFPGRGMTFLIDFRRNFKNSVFIFRMEFDRGVIQELFCLFISQENLIFLVQAVRHSVQQHTTGTGTGIFVFPTGQKQRFLTVWTERIIFHGSRMMHLTEIPAAFAVIRIFSITGINSPFAGRAAAKGLFVQKSAVFRRTAFQNFLIQLIFAVILLEP